MFQVNKLLRMSLHNIGYILREGTLCHWSIQAKVKGPLTGDIVKVVKPPTGVDMVTLKSLCGP